MSAQRCVSCIYGTRDRCLMCDRRRPNPGRERLLPDEVDERLRARPGVRIDSSSEPVARAPGVDDPAGWGEDGNPWG